MGVPEAEHGEEREAINGRADDLGVDLVLGGFVGSNRCPSGATDGGQPTRGPARCLRACVSPEHGRADRSSLSLSPFPPPPIPFLLVRLFFARVSSLCRVLWLACSRSFSRLGGVFRDRLPERHSSLAQGRGSFPTELNRGQELSPRPAALPSPLTGTDTDGSPSTRTGLRIHQVSRALSLSTGDGPVPTEGGAVDFGVLAS